MNSENKEQQKHIEFPIRLVKYISAAGIASRRKSFTLIQNGEVKVNNMTVYEPSLIIKKEDIVHFNDREVDISAPVYIMLNKPRGYTCTSADPYAHKKADDLINMKGCRLFSIGRLDKDSEGLILFTNDGNFTNKICHPRHNIHKTYEVSVTTPLKNSDLQEIKKGIIDSGELLRAVSVILISKNRYQFVLNEGKNREIRRIVKYFKSSVNELKRVAIGQLKLKDLPIGKWKKLSSTELEQLFKN
ncbi:MAG TPA: pseudouridine synthase [Victivallales bacterium]|nr:pseudouridine synthase [Victivallales bacterium]